MGTDDSNGKQRRVTAAMYDIVVLSDPLDESNVNSNLERTAMGESDGHSNVQWGRIIAMDSNDEI